MMPCPFLTIHIQKTLNQLLAFLNLHQHAKNQLIPSAHFLDTFNFSDLWPDWSHPFLTMPNQNIFNQHLIFANLYQHAKDETVWLIYSREIVDLKFKDVEYNVSLTNNYCITISMQYTTECDTTKCEFSI